MGASVSGTVSDRKAKEILGALKKTGTIKTYRSAGQIVRETQKSLAEKNKEDDGPKMTMTEFREKRKAEEEKKARMKKMMASLYGRERSLEEEKGEKSKAETAALRSTAKTSALDKPKKLGVQATTSALKKPEEKKPAEPIDLAID